MMTRKVVGKEAVDYFSKQNNCQVTGVRLHTVGEDKRVQGASCEVYFISSKSAAYDSAMSCGVGSEISVSYNRWGSIADVTVMKK